MITTPTRVMATDATRGFSLGACGTVLAVDLVDGEYLVEWDDSRSGPSWTDPATLRRLSADAVPTPTCWETY